MNARGGANTKKNRCAACGNPSRCFLNLPIMGQGAGRATRRSGKNAENRDFRIFPGFAPTHLRPKAHMGDSKNTGGEKWDFTARARPAGSRGRSELRGNGRQGRVLMKLSTVGIREKVPGCERRKFTTRVAGSTCLRGGAPISAGSRRNSSQLLKKTLGGRTY